MIKRIDKRGQGLLPSGVGGLIIAIAVVLVVIIGVWYFWDKISGGAEQLPEELEVAVQACELAAKGNLEVSYCQQFRDIGNKVYATCDWINDNVDGVEFEDDLDCSGFDITSAATEFCVQEGLGDSEEVNGKTCEELTDCEDGYGGEWVAIDGCSGGEIIENPSDEAPDGKNICCVIPESIE